MGRSVMALVFPVAALLAGCAGKTPPPGENERPRTFGEKAWDAGTLTAAPANARIRYTIDCDSLDIADSRWSASEKESLCEGKIPLGISRDKIDFFYMGPFLDRGSHAYYRSSRIVFWRVDFAPSEGGMVAVKVKKWLNRDYMP
jgi:hypothetical protein